MSSSPASKPPGSYRWLVPVGVAAMVVLAVALALSRTAFRDTLGRADRYTVYAEALRLYHADYGALPPTLDGLEQWYMARPDARGVLPPPAPLARPEYRPIIGGDPGEYLIMAEPPPTQWYSRTRLLIYAQPDGSAIRLENVHPEDVAPRVAEDDRKRGE